MLAMMTMTELQIESDKAIAAGDTVRAGIVEDYLRAAEIDFAECDEFADYEGIDDDDDGPMWVGHWGIND